jgi:hypothetical protein
MKRMAVALLVAVALAAGAAGTRWLLEPEAARDAGVRNPAWIPDGKVLRAVSFGHRLALADLYWLRLVQYVGAQALAKQGDFGALYPLANVTTDLDPRFGYAYQIAGSNLAGLAHRYREAELILKKGMEHLPDRWSLPFTHAVNKFLYEGDFAEAAVYARQAARVGKRPHLALLAANLSLVLDTADDYRTAADFVEEQLKLADTPFLREQLERRLVKVRTYEALSTLEKAIAAYEQRAGRKPATLAALVEAGLLDHLPADPSSGSFRYDPATGEVRSSNLGTRQPVRNTMATNAK